MARTLTTPNPRNAPPECVGVTVEESATPNPDGTVLWGANVTALAPTYYDVDRYEVYARPSGGEVGDWHLVGWGRTFAILCQSQLFVKSQAYDFALVGVSILGATVGPDGVTAVALTFAGTGLPPNDVAGFAAAADQGGVRFSWTGVNEDTNPDVLGFEIRAGATGWLSATKV